MKQDIYTHGHEKAAVDSHRKRTAENSASYLLPNLNTEMRLLDIGCETGSITQGFSNYVAEVIGLDVDEASIARAKREFGAIKGLDFTVGSVYALDFPDNYFDVVHAHQVLQHLTEPIIALREMVRVTKSGGYIAVRDADYSEMNWYPKFPELDEWRRIYRAIAHLNGANPDAGPRLLTWTHSAGLTNLTATSSSLCFVGNELTQWAETWAERTEKSSFTQQVIKNNLASKAEMAGIAAAWRRFGADPDAWFGYNNSEILAKVNKKEERN